MLFNRGLRIFQIAEREEAKRKRKQEEEKKKREAEEILQKQKANEIEAFLTAAGKYTTADTVNHSLSIYRNCSTCT